MADALFDGENLIMTLPDQDIVDIEADLYSAWKKWPDAMKYEPAFRLITSEPLIVGVLESGAYFRFQNQLGWRVRPFAATRVVNLTNGSFTLEDSTVPAGLPPLGGHSVMILGIPPVTQRADLLNQVVEGAYTVQDSLKISNAALAALVSGVGTSTEKFRDLQDLRDRLTVNYDGSGNRASIVLDLT